MSIKKIIGGLTPEEIADAFVLPAKLTVEERKEADRELAEHRKNRRSETTENQKLHLNLLQLKFQLEDYVKSEWYNPEFTFGYFLERYLQLTSKNKKEFAKEIQVHETFLSHLISNRREPNESIMVRLELHSGNVIPAVYWFKLVEKEKEHQLQTDTSLRDKERQYVLKNPQLSF